MLYGIAVLISSVTYDYFDNFRRDEMPTHFIQVQRVYFVLHTYELKGKKVSFHAEWEDFE